MPCACPVQGSAVGYFFKGGAGAADFTTGTIERYALNPCNFRSSKELIIDEASIGARVRHVSQVRQGINDLSGEIAMRPGPVHLDSWLPRILGGAKGDQAANRIGVRTLLPKFAFLKDTVVKQFRYDNCLVSSATFRAQSGETVELEMELVGGGFAEPAIATPTVSLGTAVEHRPLVFHQAVLLIGGVDYCFSSFELTIDNDIEVEYFNSQTPLCVVEGQRTVTLNLGMPWDTNTAADVYGKGDDGTAVSIAFTNGGLSTQAHVPKLYWADTDPVIATNRGLPWTIEGEAFSQAADTVDETLNEVYFINDSTP